ncbi:MAG TPA: glycosyltransferase [Ignavibacteriaceae bacterium]|nr:glycosyltransferase [Ignavibacteriaceae bacterium]
MNILNLLNYSPDFGGGIAKHLLALGKIAKMNDHKLYIGFPKKRDWQNELELNSQVIIIPEIENSLKFRFPGIIRKVCESYSIDILHIHFKFAMAFSLACSIRKWEVPAIYHWHNPPIALNEFQTSQKKLKGRLKRLTFSMVARFTDLRVIDQHISISKEITELLVRNKWTKKNKISYLANGVSSIDSSGIILKEKDKSKPVIGTVANFRTQKDHETLLNAFSFMRKGGQQNELWIIGDGPTRPRMEKLASELGIDSSVRFLGTLSNPYEMFQRFDVFVLSTHYEGHPLVLLEAMSFGIPIVATRISSIPEVIIDGVNGLLVNPRDSLDLAQAISIILTDKLLYSRLSAAAIETYKNQQTVDDWASYMISLYKRILKDKIK